MRDSSTGPDSGQTAISRSLPSSTRSGCGGSFNAGANLLSLQALVFSQESRIYAPTPQRPSRCDKTERGQSGPSQPYALFSARKLE